MLNIIKSVFFGLLIAFMLVLFIFIGPIIFFALIVIIAAKIFHWYNYELDEPEHETTR